MQAERGQDMRHRAVGDCTSLGAGMLVTLTGDQVPGVKGAKYLCLSATHSYVSDCYGSGDTTSDGYAYSGSYVLMPDTAPLASERKTHISVVQGPQTAVVVGEGEIDCDEYLQGDEKIKLTGMSHTHEVLSLRLPGAKLALRSTTAPEAEVLPMNLDTVDLDVTGVDDGTVKITMLWRVMVPHREDYFNAEIIRG